MRRKLTSAVLLSTHVLVLRVKMASGQYAHHCLAHGTQKKCEREAWNMNITGVRGPLIVKAELAVLPISEWDRIRAMAVPERR